MRARRPGTVRIVQRSGRSRNSFHASGIETVAPGRATLMQGSVHLAIFGAFLFLSFTR